jgi:hypothetical protein
MSGTLPPILLLQEQILAHPGKRIVDALQLLDDPVRLLLAPNAKQLDAHLATFPFDAAGNLVFDAMRRELMDDYLGEALRLMHNVVAAVGTVIDQTRIVLEANWPDPTNLVRIRFADALRRFRSDGRLLVVRELRTYILHLRLPGISGTLGLGPNGLETSSVNLICASLLEWSGWRPAARAYLRQAGDVIELQPLTADYLRAAVELHLIVVQAIKAEEYQLLQGYQVLARQHDDLVRESLLSAAESMKRFREVKPPEVE